MEKVQLYSHLPNNFDINSLASIDLGAPTLRLVRTHRHTLTKGARYVVNSTGELMETQRVCEDPSSWFIDETIHRYALYCLVCVSKVRCTRDRKCQEKTPHESHTATAVSTYAQRSTPSSSLFHTSKNPVTALQTMKDILFNLLYAQTISCFLLYY